MHNTRGLAGSAALLLPKKEFRENVNKGGFPRRLFGEFTIHSRKQWKRLFPSLLRWKFRLFVPQPSSSPLRAGFTPLLPFSRASKMQIPPLFSFHSSHPLFLRRRSCKNSPSTKKDRERGGEGNKNELEYFFAASSTYYVRESD